MATELIRATTGKITIGRSPDCDQVIDHPMVSGHHARLTMKEGGWLLEDLGGRGVMDIVQTTIEFDADGDFFIRGPTGKVGNKGQFWFEDGLLLIETKNARRSDYCDNGVSSYVVFVSRANDQTTRLRFHKVLDLCDLRSGALPGDPLTPADVGWTTGNRRPGAFLPARLCGTIVVPERGR